MQPTKKNAQINFRVSDEEFDALKASFPNRTLSEAVRSAVNSYVAGKTDFAVPPEYKPAQFIEALNSDRLATTFSEQETIFFVVPNLSIWGHGPWKIWELAARTRLKRQTVILTMIWDDRKYEPLMREFMFEVFDLVRDDVPLNEISSYVKDTQVPFAHYIILDAFCALTPSHLIQQMTVPFGVIDVANVYLKDGHGSTMYAKASKVMMEMLGGNLVDERDAVAHYLAMYEPDPM
jgi:hypothetical protein